MWGNGRIVHQDQKCFHLYADMQCCTYLDLPPPTPSTLTHLKPSFPSSGGPEPATGLAKQED